jgi:RNA polymerase sigma-70 factor (ECF subfamily)
MNAVSDKKIGQIAEDTFQQELLSQALSGCRTSLETLLTQDSNRLYRTVYRLLGNREDTEDVLQEGMFNASRNLQNFQGRSKFSTWLTRIVINAALMHRRRERTRPMVSLDESAEGELSAEERFASDEPNPEQLCARIEFLRDFEDNLERLSPLQRQAFALSQLEGLSAGEAAKTLGVSRSAIKTRIQRARRQLANNLRRRGPAQVFHQMRSFASTLG